MRSVQRLAKEAPVDHVDDATERKERRIGRPNVIENFRNQVVAILKQEPDLHSLEVGIGVELCWPYQSKKGAWRTWWAS